MDNFDFLKEEKNKADTEITEFTTRKLYIDVMLEEVGWIRGYNNM